MFEKKERGKKETTRKGFRFTLGGKISLAIAITMLFLVLISFFLVRYMLFVHIVSEDIQDVYSMGATAMDYMQLSQCKRMCEYARDAYEKSEDEDDDDYYELFPTDAELLTKKINVVKIRDDLEVVKRNFDEVKDIGFCLWDKENEQLIIVQDTDNTERGTRKHFDETKGGYVYSMRNHFIQVEKLVDANKGQYIRITALIPLSQDEDDGDDDDDYSGDNNASYMFIIHESDTPYYLIYSYMGLYVLFIAIISVAVHQIAGRLFSRQIVKPLKGLSRAANNYTANPDKLGQERFFDKIDIKSNDEVGDLAIAMKTMEVEIRQYIENLKEITEEKQKLATELEIAARIQMNMLPEKLELSDKSYEIYPFMRPARSVGGDFYDFFPIDEHRVALVIADVSDKGVPAALFMAVSKILIKGRLGNVPDDVARALRDANNLICSNNKDMMFVTVFAGIYDERTRTLKYVNAGHEDPIVYRKAEDKYSYIMEEHDMFMGIEENLEFTLREITLESGDRLFLYTDGVTEAADAQENRYGTERLLNALNEDTSLMGDDFINNLWDKLSQFQDMNNQADDITMVLFEA